MKTRDRAADSLGVGFALLSQNCMGPMQAASDGDDLTAQVDLAVFEVDVHDK